MNYNTIISIDAQNDLKQIFAFIAADSSERASKFIKELQQAVNRLKDFPYSGSAAKVPELITLGIRILPYKKYIVFYTVSDKLQEVRIIRVLNAAVNYLKLFT